jgi:hypothetical protein
MIDEDVRRFSEFANDFLATSNKYTERNSKVNTFSLGNESVQLFLNDETEVGTLIRSAFIESQSRPSFTLQIWDSSKGDSLPDLSWARLYLKRDSIIPYSMTAHYKVAFDRSQGFIFVYDSVNNIGSVWIRDHSQVDLASFITPFRLMMSWMADKFGGEIIHASAIGVGNKGVLINGPTGSGKSTLGLYAALQGYKILADDVALLFSSRIFSVYSRAKAQSSSTPVSLRGLKTIEIQGSINGKTIIPLNNFGQNFIQCIDLNVLILPIFAHLNHFERIRPSTALKLLAPNSLRELMGGSTDNFARLSHLTRTTPVYRLALSDNLDINFRNLLQIVEES